MVTMRETMSGHHESGLKTLLAHPRVYNLFQHLISRRMSLPRLVCEGVKPFPGCKILDIGCGTARIIPYLPESISEYSGFDMNNSYIEFAQKKWGNLPQFSFYCQNLSVSKAVRRKHYDIILLLGVLHHLTEEQINDLFIIVDRALKPSGALISFDPVYEKSQARLAHYLISTDRGHSVRTRAGYRKLLTCHFSHIEEKILHDCYKLPYTVYQTRCYN